MPAPSATAMTTLRVAACSPRTINIGPRRANPATTKMLQGQETEPAAIAAHVRRFLAHHLRLLARAADAGAQLAVIPEDALRLSPLVAAHGRSRWCRKAIADAQETFVSGLAGFCQRRRLHVVGGTVTVDARGYRNSALLLDPTGREVARYHKTHLPPGEAAVITPGDELPVFSTSLGRIGFLICWDIIYPETFAALARQGAQLVIHPTFGHATERDEIVARARAIDWGVPLVISMWGGWSCIIDGEGQVLHGLPKGGEAFALATLIVGQPRRWLTCQDTRLGKVRPAPPGSVPQQRSAEPVPAASRQPGPFPSRGARLRALSATGQPHSAAPPAAAGLILPAKQWKISCTSPLRVIS